MRLAGKNPSRAYRRTHRLTVITPRAESTRGITVFGLLCPSRRRRYALYQVPFQFTYTAIFIHQYHAQNASSIIMAVIIIITVSVVRRPFTGCVYVVVAGTGGTVAVVVAISTDEIFTGAVLAVALVARNRSRPSVCYVIIVKHRQHGTDNHDGCRDPQTDPTGTLCATTRRRSHRSTSKTSVYDAHH